MGAGDGLDFGMRITGGEFRGRVLRVPRSQAVRPTQDMVRESLFSMLGARVAGAKFLDLFAGTGVVGLEACSRGASSVCWVESSGAALRVLEENVRMLCDGRGSIVRGDVLRVLRNGLPGAPFDVIFADPPYEKKSGGTTDTTPKKRERGFQVSGVRGVDWGRILEVVEVGGQLKPGGWLVMEQGEEEPAVAREGWVMVRDRRYGGTRLRILEWLEREAGEST